MGTRNYASGIEVRIVLNHIPLKKKEIATRLNVHERTVRRWEEEGTTKRRFLELSALQKTNLIIVHLEFNPVNPDPNLVAKIPELIATLESLQQTFAPKIEPPAPA